MATINTVAAGYGPQVSPVWRSSGIFTRSLSSFDGERREAAHRAGFRAVAVHLANTDQTGANAAELELLLPEYRRRGWSVVGWGTFGQGTDPALDGRQAAYLSDAFRLDGWIANGEAWCEGAANYWKPSAFMAGWRSRDGSRPLMLSCLSSVTGMFARSMDYSPFLGWAGAAISPECYCASNPLYTLPAMRSTFSRAKVPLERVIPTCNIRKDRSMPTRYTRWRGPRWLWTGEDTLPEQYARALVGGPA